jgi:hypothetical protein
LKLGCEKTDLKERGSSLRGARFRDEDLAVKREKWR